MTSFGTISSQVVADTCQASSSTGMYSKVFQDTVDAKKLWGVTYRTSATCVDSAPDMPMYDSAISTDTCQAMGSTSSGKIMLGLIPTSSATSASIGIVAAGLAVAAAAVIA